MIIFWSLNVCIIYLLEKLRDQTEMLKIFQDFITGKRVATQIF